MKAMRKACLIRIASPGASRAQLVDKDAITFGRSADADVLCLSTSVSRIHLIARMEDGALTIEDQGSANGTFVGTQQAPPKQPIPLKPGDRVRLGESEETISFEIVDMPAELGDFETRRNAMKAAAREAIQDAVRDARLASETERDKAVEAARAQGAVRLAEAEKVAAKTISDARAAASSVKIEAQAEAEKILSEARNRLRESREAADAEVTRASRAAQLKADAILDQASATAEESLREARETAAAIRNEADKERESTRAKAASKAQELAKSAELEAERIVENARARAAELETNKSKSVEEAVSQAAFRAQREAEAKVAEALAEAQERAAAILRDADTRASVMIRDANHASAAAVKESETRMAAFVRHAEETAAELAKTSEAAAFKTRKEADEAAVKTRADADADAARVRAAVEQAANEREQSALARERETNDRIAEAATRNQAALDRLARSEAAASEARKKEEDAIAMRDRALRALEETQSEAEKISARLQKQIETVKAEADELERQVGNLVSDRVSLEKTLQEGRDALADLERQKASAGEDAEKARISVVQASEAAKRAALEEREKILKENKALKEKGIIEADEYKRDSIAKIAEDRLKAIEGAKQLMLEEEKRVQGLRKHQVAEMAKQMEVLLVPKLKDRLPAAEAALDGLRSDIHDTARRVLTGDNSAVTNEIERVTTFEPSAEEARKARRKRALITGVSSGIAAAMIAIFWTPIRNTMFGEPGSRSAASIAADEILKEKRMKIKFAPPQIDAYQQSYVDNVLYMKGYVATKLDRDFQNKWILDANDFITNKLGLSDTLIVEFSSIENSLVRDLDQMKENGDERTKDQTVSEMRKREAADRARLVTLLKTEANYARLRGYEQEKLAAYMASRNAASVPSK